MNHRDPEPLWSQLAAVLRAGIADGTWDDALPSESQLMGEHQVSRGTVRRALQTLADEDLIITIQGRGSFVRQE